VEAGLTFQLFFHPRQTDARHGIETMAMPDWVHGVQQADQLLNQGKLEEAAALAEWVVRNNPDWAPANQALGLALAEAARPQEAIPHLARALELQPGLVPAHTGLGRCYYLLGDLDRALRHFETAIFLQPNHAMAHFNRGTVALKQGRYREGWLDYEWRAYCGLVQWPAIPRPRWDGCPLHGRSILVHTEQGLGDVLQFIRFLPELARRGARIVFACQRALHALLRPLACVDEWFPIDEPGQITFEVYSSLLSLPALLGVEEAMIPREVPYVVADPARVERWRPRIEGLAGFKVGVCWHGSPTFKGNHLRSIPLAQFAPLAAVPGVTLVSLQKGTGVEQIEASRETVPVVVLDDLDRDATFVDTAAVMRHLDLVITSDTSVAHLAGALGRPVWVLLATGCDWRWLVGRSDSPWYPTMRLFRQKAFGEWKDVFAEVATALRAEAAGSG
jgi:hypothetical protein